MNEAQPMRGPKASRDFCAALQAPLSDLCVLKAIVTRQGEKFPFQWEQTVGDTGNLQGNEDKVPFKGSPFVNKLCIKSILLLDFAYTIVSQIALED